MKQRTGRSLVWLQWALLAIALAAAAADFSDEPILRQNIPFSVVLFLMYVFHPLILTAVGWLSYRTTGGARGVLWILLPALAILAALYGLYAAQVFTDAEGHEPGVHLLAIGFQAGFLSVPVSFICLLITCYQWGKRRPVPKPVRSRRFTAAYFIVLLVMFAVAAVGAVKDLYDEAFRPNWPNPDLLYITVPAWLFHPVLLVVFAVLDTVKPGRTRFLQGLIVFDMAFIAWYNSVAAMNGISDPHGMAHTHIYTWPILLTIFLLPTIFLCSAILCYRWGRIRASRHVTESAPAPSLA